MLPRRQVEIARLEDFIRVGGVGLPLSASFGPSSAHVLKAALLSRQPPTTPNPKFTTLPRHLSTIKSVGSDTGSDYGDDEFGTNSRDDESAEKAEAARKLRHSRSSSVEDDDDDPSARIAQAKREIEEFERSISENNDAKKELLKRLQVARFSGRLVFWGCLLLPVALLHGFSCVSPQAAAGMVLVFTPHVSRLVRLSCRCWM